MDEEKIFGPLTIRQSLYTIIGVVLIFQIYNFFELKISIPIIIVIAGITLALVLNTPKIVIDEDYINKKKMSAKSPEEFEKWLDSKIALLNSHIEFRRSRNLADDPELIKKLSMIEKIKNKKDGENI